MKFPTIEELSRQVAEDAMGRYEYKGKTLREWADSLDNPKTNADRIRSMNDEELASFLMDVSIGLLIDQGVMNVKAWLQRPLKKEQPDACPNCGYLEERDWTQDDGFCPNCGAKMDEEES